MELSTADGLGDILTRLGDARDVATKEANRFFLFGLAFTLFYGAKVSGYHIDEILINRDVASLTHGAFIYLVSAQFSMILCMLRTADSIAIESSMKEVLRGGQSERNISETFPNAREWFAPITSKIRKVSSSGTWKIIFNITSVLSTILALALFLLPVIAGLYYIGDPRRLQFSTAPDIELTVVASTTILCALWIINGIGISVLLGRLEGKEAESDGDHLPRG